MLADVAKADRVRNISRFASAGTRGRAARTSLQTTARERPGDRFSAATTLAGDFFSTFATAATTSGQQSGRNERIRQHGDKRQAADESFPAAKPHNELPWRSRTSCIIALGAKTARIFPRGRSPVVKLRPRRASLFPACCAAFRRGNRCTGPAPATREAATN